MNEQDRPGDEADETHPADSDYAEHAEHAEHADFAEFAQHAEFAEFAEFAEHADHGQPGAAGETGEPGAPGKPGHPEHVGLDEHGPSQLHLPGRVPGGHGKPGEQSDVLWRSEMLHMIDQAANRLQAAGRSRIRHQDRPEPRWPVSAAVTVAIVLQYKLNPKVTLPFHLHYVLLGLEIALVLALVAANPVRIERISGPIRAASISLIVVITATNAASAALLIHVIVTAQKQSGSHPALDLILTGAAIWGTNVIAFALWYWEFDRGGPVERLQGIRIFPDLLFPQMTVPELTPHGWGPRFVDYLYMSFTNATAFSPTDVMPLARWAKLAMLVQSAVSLALGALVIARAVNILP